MAVTDQDGVLVTAELCAHPVRTDKAPRAALQKIRHAANPSCLHNFFRSVCGSGYWSHGVGGEGEDGNPSQLLQQVITLQHLLFPPHAPGMR